MRLPAIKVSVSLTDQEIEVVNRVNDERRLMNFSLAVRQIISEWNKYNPESPALEHDTRVCPHCEGDPCSCDEDPNNG